ncbi:DUF1697 domain-containing protein [Psychroserpens burtonensis]|uniref:DUF1697 domain-containing protein n=1 Tax=Psychroserpens burtonensis TaxID=49278 RepID=UPI0004164CA6|nr:DUF1697 domain-containing protein [Psychroserpens burtonensis]
MAELLDFLLKTGFEAVKTYIQSGNSILQSSNDNTEIEPKMRGLIQSHFKFDVPVMARTKAELHRVFDACPFFEDKKKNSYFVLLSKIPKPQLVDEVMKITHDNEVFHIIDDCIYFNYFVGYGNSKFNMNSFEKKLNVKAISRNLKTIVKLIAMSSEN